MIADYSSNPYLKIPQRENNDLDLTEKFPKETSLDKADSDAGRSTQSHLIKEESGDMEQIPFLQIKPFHLRPSAIGKLGELEQEIFNELIKIKTEELKGRSREMFSSQDKSDMSYDKTIDMRDSIMKKFKFEQFKRKLLPEFKKETRRYIIEKRSIKDPNINV